MHTVSVSFNRFVEPGLGNDDKIQLELASPQATARTLIALLLEQCGERLGSYFGAAGDSCKPKKGLWIFINDKQVADIDATIENDGNGGIRMLLMHTKAVVGG